MLDLSSRASIFHNDLFGFLFLNSCPAFRGTGQGGHDRGTPEGLEILLDSRLLCSRGKLWTMKVIGLLFKTFITSVQGGHPDRSTSSHSQLITGCHTGSIPRECKVSAFPPVNQALFPGGTGEKMREAERRFGCLF